MMAEQNTTPLSKNLLAEQFSKATSLYSEKRYKEAIPEFIKVNKIKNIKEAWINLGICYKTQFKFEEAENCFQKARITPYFNGLVDENDSVSMRNLGSIAYIYEKDEIARAYYGSIFDRDDTDYEAAWSYGCIGLRRFFDGKENTNLLKDWFYYDYRFKILELNTLQEQGHEEWNFIDVHKDEGIAVLRDQGRGDTLMFARYLPELEKYFERIYVYTDDTMSSIMKYQEYTEESDCKYFVPVCSLGKLLDYIPNGEWLADRREAPIRTDKLRVGCVWQGSQEHKNDEHRSCSPELFDTLTGIEKYTLAPNLPREGYKHLEANTWSDTIDNLNGLDLVITVDTAIAHLCGSMGMECWVLMPAVYSDFRWGTGGDRTMWYDSLRIIRNRGDWKEVFKNIQARLDESQK